MRFRRASTFIGLATIQSLFCAALILAASAAHSAGLLFEENVGQHDTELRFTARGAGVTLYAKDTGPWLSYVIEASEKIGHGPVVIPSRPLRLLHLGLGFKGSNPQPIIEGSGRTSSRVSYLRGSDARRWQRDVPVWRSICYRELYPGVDLEIDDAAGRPGLRLMVDRAQDLQQVQLELHGAEDFEPAEHGVLLAHGEIVRLPAIEVVTRNGERLMPPVEWPLAAAPQEPPRADKISLLDGGGWAAFLGGSDEDCASRGAMALDSSGAVYLTGHAASFDFPTTPGAFDTSTPILEDAFVAKISADGGTLVYATFLGGSAEDWGRAIAVDGSGRAIVTGNTQSDNFPTTPGAFDLSHTGGVYPDDAFVTIVTADGTDIDYSSFLGGGSLDLGATVAVDGYGFVYVGGSTRSGDFPTTPGAYDPTYNPPTAGGELDAFVVKLDPAGNGSADMVYGTYLGSGDDEGVYAMVIDGTGAVYAAGYTNSLGFPSTGGAWIGSPPGAPDGFVAKLDATGSDLIFSTFVGSGGDDSCTAVAVDEQGRIVVSGSTTSPSFPTTPGAFDRVLGGDRDLFVVKLSSDGSAPVFSTFVGGDDKEYSGTTISLTPDGSVLATGSTRSSDFPTTADCPDGSLNGIDDAVVFALASNGAALLYGTYLGGWHWEFGYGLAPTPDGKALVVAGRTRSYDFPATVGSFGNTFGGGTCFASQPCTDAFVAHLVLPMIFADGFESGDISRWN